MSVALIELVEMTATLNVVVSINSTTVMQTYWTAPLCRIPWGHHVQIIGKCKNDSKKALFYIDQIIQNNWSRNVLLNFIDSNLYERQGKAVTNFSQKLPVPTGDLAQQITKDPYSFDFLSLRTDYDEKELKD